MIFDASSWCIVFDASSCHAVFLHWFWFVVALFEFWIYTYSGHVLFVLKISFTITRSSVSQQRPPASKAVLRGIINLRSFPCWSIFISAGLRETRVRRANWTKNWVNPDCSDRVRAVVKGPTHPSRAIRKKRVREQNDSERNPNDPFFRRNFSLSPLSPVSILDYFRPILSLLPASPTSPVRLNT